MGRKAKTTRTPKQTSLTEEGVKEISPPSMDDQNRTGHRYHHHHQSLKQEGQEVVTSSCSWAEKPEAVASPLFPLPCHLLPEVE